MSVSKQIAEAKSLNVDRNEKWIIGRRPIDVSTEEMGMEIKPNVLVCVSERAGAVVGATVTAPNAPDSEAVSWVLGCMLSPMEGKRRRPARIALAGEELGFLKDTLEQLDIQVDVRRQSHPLMDQVISELERELSSPGFPPYLAQPGTDPETVADFFRAAADFYKLKPWKLFGFEVPFKVELQRKKQVAYWVVVMGVGGTAFGLNLYRSFDELVELFNSGDNAEALKLVQNTWSLGFSYEKIDEIGAAAQAECFFNEWALANKSAYPSAVVVKPSRKELARTPNRKELVELTAVTRAIADFVRVHRSKIKRQELVLGDVGQVEASGERIPVSVSLPAPEFIEAAAETLMQSDESYDESLDRANDLVYQAWEEDSKNKRVKLAKRALDMSQDCALAYLILAEDAARDDDERARLLQQAVEAGERALGDDFKALAGKFWRVLETRPYMRARQSLADFRYERGDLEGAIEDYQEMLRLNPVDNQGVRYSLSSCLLLAGRDRELRKLLKKYREDFTAQWLYTRALLSYRESGWSVRANQDLDKAMAKNKHVVDYLLERKRLPDESPPFYSLGSEEEAVIYAELFLKPWKATPGAVEWLRKTADKS
ncbi:MAG: hypothetical protein HYX78_13375 [Armatimonadetes bacterium]|nr:hypothetical protein [Armatimonadota bacterium]